MKGKSFWITAIALLCVVIIVSIFLKRPANRLPRLGNERGFIASTGMDTGSIEMAEKTSALHSIRKLFIPELTKSRTDSIIEYAMQYLGKPYVVAGRDTCGFDCSGFVHYIFKQFGIELPHQSTSLDKVGEYVPFNDIKRGDILIFTGTNSKIRNPGHVGIVISENGGPVQFIHSSTYDGVKISQVDSTRYETRYMAARRVLEE